MKTIERINALFIKISLFFAGLSLIALVLLTTANVGFRVVSQSMYGVIEIVTWFGVCINAFGLAYAQERKETLLLPCSLMGDPKPQKTYWMLSVFLLECSLPLLLFGVFIATSVY